MTTYTTPPTATAGQTLAATDWNTKVRDSIEAAGRPGACRVRRSTSQAVGSGSISAVVFDVEVYDTGNMWAVGNPSRLTAPVNGIYAITFGAQFAINSTGARILFLQKTASAVTSYAGMFNSVGNATFYLGATVHAEDTMNAGDYFECMAYQASGVTLNLDTTVSTYPIWASMSLIAYT